MNLEYEITEQDFIHAQRLAIKSSPARIVRWTRLAMPLFGVGLSAFLIRAVAQQGFSWRVIPASFFCLLFISMPLLNRRSQKQLYSKTASLHGKLFLGVDDNGLQFQGPTFSSQVGWSNFCRFIEDENSFLIYQNSQVFNLVPKRSLSAEQIAELRQRFEAKIPDPANE
jgi:hypothetical protein